MTNFLAQLLVHHLFSLVTLAFVLLLIPSAMQQRRAPGSTMAWLILIAAIPYLGIPAYLLLGGRKIRRLAAGKGLLYAERTREQARETAAHSAGSGDDVIRQLLLQSGAPVRRDGNRLEFLASGEEAFDRIMERIRSARQSIAISTFILANDPVGAAIIEALLAQAAAGRKVRVLLDSFGSFSFNRAWLRELRSKGVEVRFFLPLLASLVRGYANLRNHRKLLLVDGQHAILGGMNMGSEYMGPDRDRTRWKDLAVWVQGPVVEDLRGVFGADWVFSGGKAVPPAEGARPSGPIGNGGKAVCQAVGSGPDVRNDSLYDAILTATFSALERILIVTPYFVPDEALARALELAARRGVRVEILVPRRSNHALADLARSSYLRQAQTAGARILFYPTMLHAKVTLFDDRIAIVGSANMDVRSLLLNYELSLFLYSSAEIAWLQRWFDGLAASCQVGLAPRRPWQALFEGVGRILSPMI